MRPLSTISIAVVLISGLLLLLDNYLIEDLSSVALPILAAGIIFPGIPHGALDHKLSAKSQISLKAQASFIVTYLLIMLIVALTWFLWVNVGVILFILYSAWHFGETDTRSMKIYSPLMAFVFGLSLLSFILSTHGEGYNQVMDQLGSVALKLTDVQMTVIAWISLAGLFLPLINYKKLDKLVWGTTISVLLLSTQLPLLVAFLLYFVGLHSFRGWYDIHRQTGMSHVRMIVQALPFSLGAYFTFFLVWWFWNAGQLNLQLLVPAFFVFLAAISLPHILFMHKFYARSE